jgi:hypothetical protein
MQLPMELLWATAFFILSGGSEQDFGFLLRGWDLASLVAP